MLLQILYDRFGSPLRELQVIGSRSTAISTAAHLGEPSLSVRAFDVEDPAAEVGLERPLMRQIESDARLVAEIILQLRIVLGVVILQHRADLPGPRSLGMCRDAADGAGRDRQTQNNSSLHNPSTSLISRKPNKLSTLRKRVGLRQ
jgi:hypothetical protein